VIADETLEIVERFMPDLVDRLPPKKPERERDGEGASDSKSPRKGAPNGWGATHTSVALEDPGSRVDAPGVGHDQRPVLSLQERSSDLTRPDDEVPQAIELPNDDVHLSVFLEDLRSSK